MTSPQLQMKREDYPPESDFDWGVTVEGLPAGRTITSAVLTIKDRKNGSDLITKSITTSSGPQGHVDDDGAGDGTGHLTFAISRSDNETHLSTGRSRYHRVRVTLDNGTSQVVEEGITAADG